MVLEAKEDTVKICATQDMLLCVPSLDRPTKISVSWTAGTQEEITSQTDKHLVICLTDKLTK